LLERRRLKQQQQQEPPQKKSATLPPKKPKTNSTSSTKPVISTPAPLNTVKPEKQVKKYSYQEMLNLANKLNEEKLKSLETPKTQTNKPTKSIKQPNEEEIKKKLNNQPTSSQSQSQNVKRYLPGDIRSKIINQTSKQKTENRPLDSQPKAKTSSISGKTTSIITNTENNNQSAWDRAISDLKRKSSSNIKSKQTDYYDQGEVEEEEEEEHDSDMDR
jgi:hypothetical protein